MATPAEASPLSLLVLVTTSAWTLRSRPEQPGTRDEEVHAHLLLRILSEPRGRAWIREHVPADHTGGEVAHVPAGQAAAFVADLSDRMRARRLDGRHELERGQGLVVIRGHRVFLDRERYQALTGNGPADAGPDFHVGLDFRIYLVADGALGELRCNVSVSVWSAAPRSARYRPADLPDGQEDPRMVRPLEEYQRAFSEVAERLGRVLDSAYERDEPRVFGREHVPMFWVAVPAERATDPMSYLGARVALTTRLAQTLLDATDVRDSATSASVLNGEFLVVRRLRRLPGRRDVAHYLIMPGGVRRGAPISPAEQEYAAARLVFVLTDVEVRGRVLLDGLVSDLEIWQNHLTVYNAVAARGYRLWDALSTHLAMRKWLKLSHAHHAVELVHQILLQGIADIAHLATLTQDCVARVNRAAAEMRMLFDDAITERPVPGMAGGVGAALAETGLMDRVRQHGERIVLEAARVRATYDDLLRTISYAFDERRVREADALQKASALLGISIALVGAVTVLDATVDMKPDPGARAATIFSSPWLDNWVPGLAFGTSLLLGVVLVTSAAAAVAWVMRLGTLGSHGFRSLYDGSAIKRYGVWHLLKDCSTDSLEDFRRTHPVSDAQAWHQKDVRLAEQFAKMWDRASQMRRLGRSNRMGRDIAGLSHQVEQWGMHALLLTERARRMHRYRLPRLTCLHRCVAWLDGSFLALDELASTRVTMVSEEELERSLRSAGYNRDDVRRIDEWLRGQRFGTAEEALRQIDQWLGRTPVARPRPVIRIQRQIRGRMRELGRRPSPALARRLSAFRLSAVRRRFPGRRSRAGRG